MSDDNKSVYEEEEEEIEVEEEVEVTDDDAEAGSGDDVAREPGKKTQKTPGKVAPSKAVKNMKMMTPESSGIPTPRTLSPEKNPFPTFGGWTVETLKQVDIAFPALTGRYDESTNDLTRATHPENRYWKAPVVFKYGNYSSETLRFDNVYIPHHNGKSYGSSYVYLCLPGFASELFAEAGKKRAPTKVTEASLVPDKQRWWKIANKVDGSFGVINNSTKKFHAKSLETIFDGTQQGVMCSVILKFYCKASTMDKEKLRGTTVRTVAVEVIRGYIDKMDVNVQMPTRINRQKAKIEPKASSKDVASDDLMKRLAEIGI